MLKIAGVFDDLPLFLGAYRIFKDVLKRICPAVFILYMQYWYIRAVVFIDRLLKSLL